MPDEEQHPPKVETEEATEELTPKEDLPQSVPGFHLRQKLGEGGMGEVFEAEQLEPVRRRVALKLIKRGMESKEVLARFDSERQALALMSHPNVAQVYDAGTTTDGRPYFVMEFVQGVSVPQYCDTNRLTTAERLGLFTQICDGVQHAHHKGVIHRDIKPSNVLVKVQDSKPVPKIIDFGVAKAISQRLTEQTLFTAIGEFIGTPEYMSPEQAEMTELDIDTRTDVYSLGIVLYEMLVGAQPFDARELRRSGFDEMRRKIREEEPPRPSVRLSGMGEESTSAAKNRRSESSTLARQLHGDLDWITMKALEKDRTRRYDSPGELAADIGRHLRDEPVLAGPPSTTYRVKKFVRRHTVGVAASALVVLALHGRHDPLSDGRAGSQPGGAKRNGGHRVPGETLRGGRPFRGSRQRRHRPRAARSGHGPDDPRARAPTGNPSNVEQRFGTRLPEYGALRRGRTPARGCAGAPARAVRQRNPWGSGSRQQPRRPFHGKG
jgi:serine/threonine protein kinase